MGRTARDRAEDCVSYWNPTNFKGRSLIVDAVERAISEAIADGYAEAIEKLTTWQFRDESELDGESFAVFDGFGGRRGEVYRNINDKWYCSPTLGREFETMEEARTALCERVAAEIKNIR